MKKASIIFSIVSLIFFSCAYYFMQKSSKLITKSEQAVLDIEKLINSDNSGALSKLIYPDNEDSYYYKDIILKQEDHLIINNCLKYYNDEISFENINKSNKCYEIIVDAIVKNMGKSQFVKAIIGNMIRYEKEVSLKSDFPRMLFSNATLKSKLVLTFISRYRNSEKLKEDFDNNKNYFLNAISKNLYQKLFEKYINSFIESYHKIQGQEDKEAYFKNIYYEAETKNRHAEFWQITFWKRRELEKNDQTIYAILKEIKAYYES